jgi:hypothetical protein
MKHKSKTEQRPTEIWQGISWKAGRPERQKDIAVYRSLEDQTDGL